MDKQYFTWHFSGIFTGVTQGLSLHPGSGTSCSPPLLLGGKGILKTIFFFSVFQSVTPGLRFPLRWECRLYIHNRLIYFPAADICASGNTDHAAVHSKPYAYILQLHLLRLYKQYIWSIFSPLSSTSIQAPPGLVSQPMLKLRPSWRGSVSPACVRNRPRSHRHGCCWNAARVLSCVQSTETRFASWAKLLEKSDRNGWKGNGCLGK